MTMTTKRRTWLALPVAFSLLASGLVLAAAPASAVEGPFVVATPSPITAAAFETEGIRIQGQSRNTGGSIQRQDIDVTSPSGVMTKYTYFNPATPDDGSFDRMVKSASTPAELGTYSVRTYGIAAGDAVATTTFEVVSELPPTPAEDPEAFINVDPAVISPDAFIASGVQVSGLTHDNGDSINRSDIVLTAPSGAAASYFDLTGDGTFNVNVKPKDSIAINPVETGTYTLVATSLLRPEFNATTTFVVEGTQTPPPASIAVSPATISPADFVASGVQASGRTFDSGSEVDIERSDIVLTSPTGKTANYFDLTSDGTFNVNVKPKGDVPVNPVEEGTYTLTATSLQNSSYTATTTFNVVAPPPPLVIGDPFVEAEAETTEASDFAEFGLGLTGFTEDTIGDRTRQDIFVTSPSGVEFRCEDFTGDGSFDIRVYPQEAPKEGPNGENTCALGLATVELGTYEVLSYGFIREDARATTTFEIVADAPIVTPSPEPTPEPTPQPTPQPAPGTGTDTGVSPDSDDAADGTKVLASTGADASWFAGIALLLTLLGAAAVVIARRRRFVNSGARS